MNISMDSYQIVGLEKNSFSYKTFNGKAQEFSEVQICPISFFWTRSQGMAFKARNDRLQGTENCVNVCYASWFLPAINSSAKPFCWHTHGKSKMKCCF